MSKIGNEQYKQVEQQFINNLALADELVSAIAEKHGEPISIVEKTIYKVAVSTGNAPLSVACIVSEYFTIVKDTYTDIRNEETHGQGKSSIN